MSVRRYALLAGVLAALSPSMIFAAPLPAHGAGQSTPANFAVLPGSQQQGQPVKRMFTYTLAAGRSLSDTVMIVNPSKTSWLAVRLSVSDAVTRTQGGGMDFVDAGPRGRLGLWLRLAATTVRVPPYHISYVPLALRLPAALPAGEYEGAINATDLQATTVDTGSIGVRVFLNRRCLIALRVAGPARASLTVGRVGTGMASRRPVLTMQLQNAGTLIAYPAASTIGFTGRGRSYSMRVSAGLLLGGDATQLSYALPPGMVPGAYAVRMRLAYLAQVSPGAPMSTLYTTWSGRVTVPAAPGR